MPELKTKPTSQKVESFLKTISDSQRRADSKTLLNLMKKCTNTEGQMWGTSIIGFGNYPYKDQTENGKSWFLIGFSPRKQTLTLYFTTGFSRYEDLMQKLGKHKTGKSCLHIKKLKDIDLNILEELIQESLKLIERNASSTHRK
jgi:hypothetical protein